MAARIKKLLHDDGISNLALCRMREVANGSAC